MDVATNAELGVGFAHWAAVVTDRREMEVAAKAETAQALLGLVQAE